MSCLAGTPSSVQAQSSCFESSTYTEIAVGLSRSEGGFKENKVSSASVLDVQAANDKKGKPYYKYEILTRTGMLCVLFSAASIYRSTNSDDKMCPL